MSVKHDGYEYEAYGSGYVTRPEGSTQDWQPAPEPLPQDVADKFAVRRMAKKGEVQRARPRTEGMFKGGVQGGAIIKPNATLAADAAKIGLSEDEFRTWINDDQAHETRTRIPEKDFDALAQKYNMTPQELRDRFAGRYTSAG